MRVRLVIGVRVMDMAISIQGGASRGRRLVGWVLRVLECVVLVCTRSYILDRCGACDVCGTCRWQRSTFRNRLLSTSHHPGLACHLPSALRAGFLKFSIFISITITAIQRQQAGSNWKVHRGWVVQRRFWKIFLYSLNEHGVEIRQDGHAYFICCCFYLGCFYVWG